MALKEHRFESVADVHKESQRVLGMVTVRELQEAFRSLQDRWNRCVNSQADYCEGLNEEQSIQYFTQGHFRGISDSHVFHYQGNAGIKKTCLLTVSRDTIRLWGLKIGKSISCDYVRNIYTEFADHKTQDTPKCGDSGRKNILTAITVGLMFLRLH